MLDLLFKQISISRPILGSPGRELKQFVIALVVEVHGGDDVDGDAAQDPDGHFNVALKPQKFGGLPEQGGLVDRETGRPEAKLFDVALEVVGVERPLETHPGQVDVPLLSSCDGQLHVEGRHLEKPPFK